MTRVTWRDTPLTTTPLAASQLNDLEARKAEVGEMPVNVCAPPYNADRTGATDSTNAFNLALAAAGPGGGVFVPRGIYRVGDVTFPYEGQTLTGEGAALDQGSILYPSLTTPTYLLKAQGKRYGAIRDIGFHGNARACRGLLLEATASATTQSWQIDSVSFYQLSVGLHLGPGSGITQADKTTVFDSQFTECDVGLWNQSSNGQQTILVNPNFSSIITTNIRMAGGSLGLLGGQMQGTGVGRGIEFTTGSVLDWVWIQDFIFEGPAIDVDGSAAWPPDGLVAQNTVFQGATQNILLGQANSRVLLQACRHNIAGVSLGNGILTTNATGCAFSIMQSHYGVPSFTGTQTPTVVWLQDGQVQFGTGRDVSLSRLGVAVLDTQTISANTSGPSSTHRVYMGDISGLVGGSTGGFALGNALDTFLYRGGAGLLKANADIDITTPGKGLRVAEGTNAKMGTATLAAGTVTVSTTAVTATSRVFLTAQTTGGTAGALRVSARTAGTSFVITSTSASDTSSVAWMLVEPG